jgi:hypothetical protein
MGSAEEVGVLDLVYDWNRSLGVDLPPTQMNQVELSERLGRPALWIGRMRKLHKLGLLKDSGYRRLVVLACAWSSSLHLPLAALPSIRSSESWLIE